MPREAKANASAGVARTRSRAPGQRAIRLGRCQWRLEYGATAARTSSGIDLRNSERRSITQTGECLFTAQFLKVDQDAATFGIVDAPRNITDLMADLEHQSGRRVVTQPWQVDFQPQALRALALSDDFRFGERTHGS